MDEQNAEMSDSECSVTTGTTISVMELEIPEMTPLLMDALATVEEETMSAPDEAGASAQPAPVVEPPMITDFHMVYAIGAFVFYLHAEGNTINWIRGIVIDVIRPGLFHVRLHMADTVYLNVHATAIQLRPRLLGLENEPLPVEIDPEDYMMFGQNN